jgi:tRNA threonylcarbamoyladenosine biosynthesis protein TsaE
MISVGNFVSHSPEETFEFAYKLGEEINAGSIFLLSGDLGAGKTVFTKGLAAGLGIDPADVASPTFTLINQHDGRLRLVHIDLYRLEGGAEVWYGLGLDEILSDSEAVVVIEWAERLGDFRLGPSTAVEIKIISELERELILSETNP